MTEEKRGPGRPRKVLEREPLREPKQWTMKAGNNWDSVDPNAEDSPDRLRIEPSLVPEGMSLLWVTDSVYGQPMPQHRAGFERKGWTPVHPEDFDGRFDGMFNPRGSKGEILMEGLVLMARPEEMTIKAKRQDRRNALEAIQIKEQALRSGSIGTTLDSQHPSALNTNRINKTVERLEIPD